MARMCERRPSDRTIPPCGTPPPTNPVLPPLSNDGDSSVSAGRNNERDVAGIGRPNDGERVAVKEAAPFPEMGCNLCGGP